MRSSISSQAARGGHRAVLGPSASAVIVHRATSAIRDRRGASSPDDTMIDEQRREQRSSRRASTSVTHPLGPHLPRQARRLRQVLRREPGQRPAGLPSARRSASSRRSPSASRARSLPCVPSTPAASPAATSRRVFRASRRFSRRASRRQVAVLADFDGTVRVEDDKEAQAPDRRGRRDRRGAAVTTVPYSSKIIVEDGHEGRPNARSSPTAPRRAARHPPHLGSGRGVRAISSRKSSAFTGCRRWRSAISISRSSPAR